MDSVGINVSKARDSIDGLDDIDFLSLAKASGLEGDGRILCVQVSPSSPKL